MAKYKETSMGAIFQNRVEEYGDKTLVIWKNQGKWEEISWNKMNELVRDLGLFLIARGIQPGDKVCLFSPNRYEWWVADLAIISVGAVNVPIYATNSAEESRYIIENSDAKMCFVGTKEHMSKILEVKPKLPNLGDVILFDVMDKLPAGVVGTRPGPLMASTDVFSIEVRGKGGHGSRPEAAIDPILPAAQIVVAVVVTDSGRPHPRIGGLTVAEVKGEDGLR